MMSKTKKYITAATTFSVALGIGFVMQYGDAVAARWGAEKPVVGPATQAIQVPEVTPVSASVAVPTNLIIPQANTPIVSDLQTAAVTDVPEDLDTPMFDLSGDSATVVATVETIDTAPDAAVATTDDVAETDVAAGAEACDLSFVATPAELAMVTLTIDSPCNYSMIATIHHGGIMFEGIMDENGMLTVDVPALSEEAFFVVSFEDGTGAAALTGVPELAMYDRAILQWQGNEDVQLHALEFGAGYGEDGHIWAASAADRSRAVAGEGGFLTRLGHDGLPDAHMVEIYTFPSGMTAREGDVILSVEAEVTERNCGREVAAQGIQIAPDAEPTIMDLTMAIPDCEAIGEYLVLKNMFEDLTLAAK